MKQSIFIIIIILISGCHFYSDNDLEFNKEELKHFSNYEISDTIYFISNLGNIDTMTIVNIEIQKGDNLASGLGDKPLSSKWIKITHLPNDTSSQEFFHMLKDPANKRTQYGISYKDFYSWSDKVIGEYHSDTLTLNDLKINNYYIVKNNYQERIIEPKSIEIVCWTDKYGLTAYKSKGGEIWTIRLQ